MRFRFDRFELDTDNRRLSHDGSPLDLNNRYLDALALLLSDPGKLVSKDRFMAEVWRGVPVTDEALTQGIRSLRRLLGDDAARPRFIETVPKHGYRFIAPVQIEAEVDGVSSATAVAAAPRSRLHDALLLGAAGTVGGVFAGLAGGLFYGFGGAGPPLGNGMGATSVLLVLLSVTMLLAMVGAAGVSFGIAAAGLMSAPRALLNIIGGAAGGLVVGALVKLLGIDAFTLLIGRSPGDITGAGEGALLGAAVGLGAWWSGRRPVTQPLTGAFLPAGLAGALAGAAIAALGGRLLGGSLDQLSRGFPESRLRLDRLGALVGEENFGAVSQLVTCALEGALFAAAIVAALTLARRGLEPKA